jgi:hypothetical protein
MQGEAQAIMRVGPAPTGSGALNANFDITPAVDGSAEWPIPGAGTNNQGGALPGCWITLTNYSAANIRFCTGVSVAGRKDSIANASATDSVLVPGATQDWWCGPGVDRVRFNGAATPGVSAHRSSV